jgi:UDP-2,4-diacetamido-2,4,6-trideoxy-beta-L-altropyranose hydrolase
MSKRRPILFVCNAGPEVGGGHVMRSLTLAQALLARGLTPVFAASPEAAAILDRFAGPGIERLSTSPPAPTELRAPSIEAEAVVFDHYGLGETEHRLIAQGRSVLVIDDLADRRLGADVVLDPGLGRQGGDYAGLIEPGARLLLGPAYALVRQAFVEARGAALARRSGNGEVAHVLVSLGLTDVGGISWRVVNRILPRLGQARLDVVLGAGARSREPVERLAARDARVQLHIDARDMADLTARADLVVGAGGSSSWERCVLGAPTLLLVLAPNQAQGGRALEAAGAAETIDVLQPDFEAAFDRAFTGLMRSPDRRSHLSRAAVDLCDGAGAPRAAQVLVDMIAG